MALTNAFYEAVQSGNVRRVRIMGSFANVGVGENNAVAR